MSDAEAWSLIVSVLVAVLVRLIDHYFPAIAHAAHATDSRRAEDITRPAAGSRDGTDDPPG